MGSPLTQDVPTDRMDKRSEHIRAMFAGVARRYDLLNHLLSLNIDRYWRRKTVRTVPPAGPWPILDLCTGTGDLALGYAKVAGGAQVIAADFCPEMLERAAEKNRRRHAGLKLVVADAQRLPFPSNRFQIVSIAFGLRNVADYSLALGEMVRVCRPGGSVAILEFSRPRQAVLRWLYLAYFNHLLPRIGRAVSDDDTAYSYLPASVLAFPDGPELAARMEAAGLEKVRFMPMTAGIATLYVGQKPGNEG